MQSHAKSTDEWLWICMKDSDIMREVRSKFNANPADFEKYVDLDFDYNHPDSF